MKLFCTRLIGAILVSAADSSCQFSDLSDPRIRGLLSPEMNMYRVNRNGFNILNKSENATPDLFATYIQNYANQECN